MVITEPHHQFPAVTRASAVAPDAAFQARWDAWVARGRVHELRARRKFTAGAVLFAIAAATLYAVLHA